ncbi:NUDIX domain-containing protein [Virgibacillus sp. MSP4-1]|uniref:NUDIX hydrolase n=1 Tax=Virgibacillus sp. MSP4-1 TaxID=2700081 RepID=UPI00039E564F|nr:NUDIX domain-containing protein [Virgibacillus sp. MSP4-1]QHS23355.1 NUDIX domain-containing protein [Virgibacillus sp. MSP4-1]
MDERLDVLDDDLQVIGQEYRKAVHEQEWLHAAFQCWLYMYRNGIPYLFFQVRNARVNYPNLLDITVGGHLKAGEGPEEGSREMKEEVGLEVPFAELTPLGIIRDTLQQPNGKQDRECCYVYAYHYKRDITELRINPDEVAGIVCLPMDDFKQILERNDHHYRTEALTYQGNQIRTQSLNLTIKDFVPHTEAYYEFVLDHLSQLHNAK